MANNQKTQPPRAAVPEADSGRNYVDYIWMTPPGETSPVKINLLADDPDLVVRLMNQGFVQSEPKREE